MKGFSKTLNQAKTDFQKCIKKKAKGLTEPTKGISQQGALKKKCSDSSYDVLYECRYLATQEITEISSNFPEPSVMSDLLKDIDDEIKSYHGKLCFIETSKKASEYLERCSREAVRKGMLFMRNNSFSIDELCFDDTTMNELKKCKSNFITAVSETMIETVYELHILKDVILSSANQYIDFVCKDKPPTARLPNKTESSLLQFFNSSHASVWGKALVDLDKCKANAINEENEDSLKTCSNATIDAYNKCKDNFIIASAAIAITAMEDLPDLDLHHILYEVFKTKNSIMSRDCEEKMPMTEHDPPFAEKMYSDDETFEITELALKEAKHDLDRCSLEVVQRKRERCIWSNATIAALKKCQDNYVSTATAIVTVSEAKKPLRNLRSQKNIVNYDANRILQFFNSIFNEEWPETTTAAKTTKPTQSRISKKIYRLIPEWSKVQEFQNSFYGSAWYKASEEYKNCQGNIFKGIRASKTMSLMEKIRAPCDDVIMAALNECKENFTATVKAISFAVTRVSKTDNVSYTIPVEKSILHPIFMIEYLNYKIEIESKSYSRGCKKAIEMTKWHWPWEVLAPKEKLVTKKTNGKIWMDTFSHSINAVTWKKILDDYDHCIMEASNKTKRQEKEAEWTKNNSQPNLWMETLCDDSTTVGLRKCNGNFLVASRDLATLAEADINNFDRTFISREISNKNSTLQSVYFVCGKKVNAIHPKSEVFDPDYVISYDLEYSTVIKEPAWLKALDDLDECTIEVLGYKEESGKRTEPISSFTNVCSDTKMAEIKKCTDKFIVVGTALASIAAVDKPSFYFKSLQYMINSEANERIDFICKRKPWIATHEW